MEAKAPMRIHPSCTDHFLGTRSKTLYSFIKTIVMQVEEILDEEEYKRLLGDLTFDISDHSDSPASQEMLDFDQMEDPCAASAWKAINSAILSGPTNLLRRTVPLAPPLPPSTSFGCLPQHTTPLTPLEAEFLDRVSSMHSQNDKIRQSFGEAKRRVETDNLIVELHREVRQRHRQHLNTTHSSLPRNSDDTKTMLLREVMGRGKDSLQPTEWNGFFIVRKPEI